MDAKRLTEEAERAIARIQQAAERDCEAIRAAAAEAITATRDAAAALVGLPATTTDLVASAAHVFVRNVPLCSSSYEQFIKLELPGGHYEVGSIPGVPQSTAHVGDPPRHYRVIVAFIPLDGKGVPAV